MRLSAGAVRSPFAVAGPISRDRKIIASCILLVSALAWAYLIQLDHRMSSASTPATMMAKMGMTIDAPWGPREYFFTFAMWAVMMVGMMSATAAPVLMLFTEMKNRHGDRSAATNGMLFGLGYVTVWAAFSALAALTQWGLHRAVGLSPSMAVMSARVAGLILVGAGLYQLTPAKSACLRQCQSPLGFLMANWREGPKGAFEMGTRHGWYCLGCCWALMLVLFSVGVMNLAWVAALTVFILAEKFGGGGTLLARVGGVVMIAFGVFVLVT